MKNIPTQLKKLSFILCGLALSSSSFAQVAKYDKGSIYDLDPPAFESTGGGLEKIIAQNDMEPMEDFSPKDFLYQLSKPVGRFVFSDGDAIGYCTASLIADDLMLTNHHCTEGIEEGVLWMGYVRSRDSSGVDRYQVTSIVERDEANDYAILRVKGNPSKKWGTVKLSKKKPHSQESLMIIHHPSGMPKHITRGRCRAANPAIERNELIHTCDTLGGSSGAPIFDFASRQVIGLHYRAYALKKQNGAKLLAELAGVSSRIAELITVSGNITITTQEPSTLSNTSSSKPQRPNIPVVTDEAELRRITDTWRVHPSRQDDFLPQGDGTVTDQRTGLQWMRCGMGQKWTGKTCEGKGYEYTWQQALEIRHRFAGYSELAIAD